MKKLTAIILAMLMMFSFVACGEDEKEDSRSNNDSYESADENNFDNENDFEEDNGSFFAEESIPEIGEYITFGSYEQDNDTSNGKEEIEWRVLDKQDGKILVISKYALDAQPYNEEYVDVTWETCTLRTWLNDDFYNKAFTANEQKSILTTDVQPHANPEYDTDAGNATQDKVFLLSIEEANKYFASDEARKCVPTAYAIDQGVYASNSYPTANGEATCWWWLRSPGGDQDYAARINDDGFVNNFSDCVHGNSLAVRPAMWIEL